MQETQNPTLAPPEAPLPAEGEEPPTTPPPTPEPAAGEPAEGAEGEPGPTVEPPSWESVRENLQGLEDIDHEELFGLEAVKPEMERRVQEAHDTAYQELQGHMQTFLQGNKQKLDEIANTSEEIATTLNRASQDGTLDQRAVEDLLRRNRPVFAALNQTYQSIGFWEGVRQYVNHIGQETGDASVAMTFLPRVERMENNIPDPTFMKDLVKKLTAKADKDAHDRGFTAGKKAGQEATSQKTKAQQRQDEGPNLAPGSPGSTSISTMADADIAYAERRITHEQYKEYRKRFGIGERPI